MGYTRRTIEGVSWMSAFRILTRLISFLKTVVIARVLTPSQFGLFGIASLVLTFLEILTETGINIIVIQSKKNVKHYINSIWIISIIRGIFISFLIIISSSLIASFFNSPDSRNIILLISLVPLVRGFINPAEIELQKELKFKYEFIFRFLIFTFDASVAIIFTIMTHSVYSLVFGLLAGALLEVFLSFAFIRPLPKFAIERDLFYEIFHKGKWITIYGIFNYFAQEGDNIVVGRVLGSSLLGIYEMAYKISILPISEITDVVGKVVFPVYSKIADDRQRLKKAFLKSTGLITVVATLVGLVIFLFPSQLITIVLGEKWISAAKVLKVLALYGILRAISGSVSTVFLAVEKQDYVTNMTFARFITLAVTIYPLVRIYGLIGAGYSVLLSVLIEIPVILYYILTIFSVKTSPIEEKNYENSSIL